MHPVLFKIGSVTIRTYGVLVATGFFVAFFLLYREAKRKNFYAHKILDLELVILVFGILGARALHVLVNLDFYSKNLLEAFFIWRGGLAFLGGFILAILACAAFALKNKMPLWEVGDFISPYMALGHAIGRIGCFLNGCCFGKVAAWPFLGVVFPGDTAYRYPTQLYASFLLLCTFIILKVAEERPHASGSVFAFYLLLYSGMRFFVDFLRGDNPTYIFGLTVSQLISAAIFTIAIFLLVLRRKYGRDKD
ncbi:MAG: prolipoprotein diacylglyceryl transferase [Candidatus Omnitrophota bacterium]